VICVGAFNLCGLPSAKTLQGLRDTGASLHRTDLQGTILIETDGTTYSVDPQRGALVFLPVGLRAWPAE